MSGSLSPQETTLPGLMFIWSHCTNRILTLWRNVISDKGKTLPSINTLQGVALSVLLEMEV